MSDEIRRVLELLSQGKVTVDEADQLVRHLTDPTRARGGGPDRRAAPGKQAAVHSHPGPQAGQGGA